MSGNPSAVHHEERRKITQTVWNSKTFIESNSSWGPSSTISGVLACRQMDWKSTELVCGFLHCSFCLRDLQTVYCYCTYAETPSVVLFGEWKALSRTAISSCPCCLGRFINLPSCAAWRSWGNAVQKCLFMFSSWQYTLQTTPYS